jgi:hypothetical protein
VNSSIAPISSRYPGYWSFSGRLLAADTPGRSFTRLWLLARRVACRTVRGVLGAWCSALARPAIPGAADSRGGGGFAPGGHSVDQPSLGRGSLPMYVPRRCLSFVAMQATCPRAADEPHIT